MGTVDRGAGVTSYRPCLGGRRGESGERVEEEGRRVDGGEEKQGVCQRLILGGGIPFIYREQLPKKKVKNISVGATTILGMIWD